MTLESLDIRTVLEESLLDLYGEMVQKEMEPEVQLPEVPVIRQLNRVLKPHRPLQNFYQYPAKRPEIRQKAFVHLSG